MAHDHGHDGQGSVEIEGMASMGMQGQIGAIP